MLNNQEQLQQPLEIEDARLSADKSARDTEVSAELQINEATSAQKRAEKREILRLRRVFEIQVNFLFIWFWLVPYMGDREAESSEAASKSESEYYNYLIVKLVKLSLFL